MKRCRAWGLAALAAALGCAPVREDLVREPPPLSPTAPASLGAVLRMPWNPDPERGPAANPLPFAPPMEAPDPTALTPRSRVLGRNALASDRFYAAGQRVRYPFAAAAEELALFELWTYGFARGWKAHVVVEIVCDGRSLARRTRDLGPTGRLLVPFVAPATGSYELVLTAAEETFRYHLVRHSNYVQIAERVDLGQRSLARGWLPDGTATARFELDVATDESVAVRVRSTRVADRAAELDRVRPAGESAADRGRDGEVALTPTFGVSVDEEQRPWRLVWLRPGPERRVALLVQQIAGSDGGFFDVSIERRPATANVRGIVVSVDDDPVPGIQLEFLREPELSPLARTRTGDDGRYEVEVMTGPYRVRYGRGRARDDARTQVDEDREVNLIWLPGA